jgi:hypothetical protein
LKVIITSDIFWPTINKITTDSREVHTIISTYSLSKLLDMSNPNEFLTQQRLRFQTNGLNFGTNASQSLLLDTNQLVADVIIDDLGISDMFKDPNTCNKVPVDAGLSTHEISSSILKCNTHQQEYAMVNSCHQSKWP